MSNYINPSRRIPLNRDTFNFGDLDEVLEWVDFFQPNDALFTISEFQRITGLDFLSEYKKDFGRDYQPPTDDVPMVEPTPEPSPAFKQEVLFYWGELQHNPKQKKFMVYTTPDDIKEWNKKYAPNAYALSQMDDLDSIESAPQQLEGHRVPFDNGNGFQTATEPQRHQMVSVTSAIAKLSAGNVTTTASRTVIDTLDQVATLDVPGQVSDEGSANSNVPDTKNMADMYRGDPFAGAIRSPRRTRSSSKLDDVLRIRHPKAAPDLIDITNMDQSGRRRLAADKEFICLDYHGRMYAVKARDHPAALRRLTSFAS